jgi:hypothetical protein
MKKIIFPLFLFILSTSLMAQPTFDLGLKAGLNNSKVTLKLDQINSESILKYHIGAFGRIGFGRIFLQPEAYFSAKGGEVEGSIIDVASRFDFNTLDVPLLLGIKVLKGEKADLRIMAGPVFNIVTSNDIEGDDLLNSQYYKDNYFGFQYGLGVDIFAFTLDLRMENSANKFYQHPDSELDGKNSTFMISLGYNIF